MKLAALTTAPAYDIIINATSVGSVAGETPVKDEAFFRDRTVAMDVIPVPAQTTFLKHAKARGAKQVCGYRMLIHQALFQMELFTGRKAPFAVMEKTVLDAVGN